MSDEIKRHAPTPRRLERLRRAGVTGASEAVTAVAVLAGATVGLALLGGRLCGWLGGVLARDLQSVVAGPTDLAGLLT
ncbi:MAG: hypothetical protein KKI08_18220 [Armatimonadetes bacterium]|nr:hypothetical protein [Armatimonadota bacterium]